MNRGTQPVCHVSFYHVQAFCKWLNLAARTRGILPAGYEIRLPTADEWRRLATCENPQQTYPWGDDWPPPSGNFGDQEIFPKQWTAPGTKYRLTGYSDKWAVTCDVAESGTNKWGLCGMWGNVWEWTATEKDGKRELLGGAWSSCDRRLLMTDPPGNNYADPQQDFDNVGIRLLLAPAREN